MFGHLSVCSCVGNPDGWTTFAQAGIVLTVIWPFWAHGCSSPSGSPGAFAYVPPAEMVCQHPLRSQEAQADSIWSWESLEGNPTRTNDFVFDRVHGCIDDGWICLGSTMRGPSQSGPWERDWAGLVRLRQLLHICIEQIVAGSTTGWWGKAQYLSCHYNLDTIGILQAYLPHIFWKVVLGKPLVGLQI